MNQFHYAQWYAVQAKPGRERFAACHVNSRGIEVFFPELKRDLHGFSNHITIRPLFPGYFFALFCPSILLDMVRYSPGVLRVVGSANSPIPVEDDVMQAIRDLLRHDGYARLNPLPLRAGDAVIISDGPLEGTKARFERELDDGRRVSILLDAIHQARVLIDRRSLEIAG
jgi:transcription antitermination factor NusG